MHLHAIEQMELLGGDVASMAWKLHAIEHVREAPEI